MSPYAARNISACVSAAAHAENSGATTKGQGDAHGKAVSKAAKDCHGNTASDNGTYIARRQRAKRHPRRFQSSAID